MARPLVSIVIPTYNDDPSHVAAAVVSAQTQTWPHVEVIVVDDGSAVPVSLPGIQVVRQDNRGLSAARNAGIAASAGDLIYPLDADDWIEPNVIERLVLHLADDVVICYPAVETFGERRGRTHTLTEVTLDDLVVFNQVVAASLFRREHWHLAGGYVEERGFPEDWVLWATILGRTGGRAVQVGDAVLHYRLHAGSLNTEQSGPESLAEARRHIWEALPDHGAQLFASSARQAEMWWAELQRAKDDAARWRRVEALLRPALRARQKGRRLFPDTRA